MRRCAPTASSLCATNAAAKWTFSAATRPNTPASPAVTARRWPQVRCWSATAGASNTTPKTASTPAALPVIDGRIKGEGDGATIAETAYIARQLGLVDALNLDGGGSSTLWTAQEGILNHPYDNKRFDHEGERGVPNCIVIRRNK